MIRRHRGPATGAAGPSASRSRTIGSCARGGAAGASARAVPPKAKAREDKRCGSELQKRGPFQRPMAEGPTDEVPCLRRDHGVRVTGFAERSKSNRRVDRPGLRRKLMLLSAPTQRPSTVADPARLAELDAFAILDTPPRGGFRGHGPARRADLRRSCRFGELRRRRPAMVSRRGLVSPACETDLNASVCAYALAEPDLLVIPDLTMDPRTRNNPLVTGHPNIRFYAGGAAADPDGAGSRQPLRDRHSTAPCRADRAGKRRLEAAQPPDDGAAAGTPAGRAAPDRG